MFVRVLGTDVIYTIAVCFHMRYKKNKNKIYF
jgi:hypothetical protein